MDEKKLTVKIPVETHRKMLLIKAITGTNMRGQVIESVQTMYDRTVTESPKEVRKLLEKE